MISWACLALHPRILVLCKAVGDSTWQRPFPWHLGLCSRPNEDYQWHREVGPCYPVGDPELLGSLSPTSILCDSTVPLVAYGEKESW